MYNILIVEDEEIERTVLKSIILDNIKNVQIVGEASNGHEAINIIKDKEIDLAFMDINIPGINGLEVIDYLKRKRPKSKVIIVTAYDKFEIAHAAIKLKVDDYLLKPVRPSILIETVQKYIKNTNRIKIETEYQEYHKGLRREICDSSYKGTMKVVKAYLDRLYSSEDFTNVVSNSLGLFVDELIDIARDVGFSYIHQLQGKANKILNSNLYNKKKYILYNEFRELIDDIYRELDKKDENAEKDINSLINYIEINIRRGVSLEDVANYSNRNVYYLSKLFKKEMGVNFIDYLTDRKMEIAKEMLSDNEIAIKNISIELSYRETTYFSKVFRKNVGMTPSKYREKAIKESKRSH